MYRSSSIRNDSAVLAPVTRPADVSSWNTHTCWVDLVHKTVSRQQCHVNTLSWFTLAILYMFIIIGKSNDKSQTNSECLLLTGIVSVPKSDKPSSSVLWSSTVVYKLLNTHHESHRCAGWCLIHNQHGHWVLTNKEKDLTQGPLLDLFQGILTASHGLHHNHMTTVQYLGHMMSCLRDNWADSWWKLLLKLLKALKKMRFPNKLF